jgi:hypothetical protein
MRGRDYEFIEGTARSLLLAEFLGVLALTCGISSSRRRR